MSYFCHWHLSIPPTPNQATHSSSANQLFCPSKQISRYSSQLAAFRTSASLNQTLHSSMKTLWISYWVCLPIPSLFFTTVRLSFSEFCFLTVNLRFAYSSCWDRSSNCLLSHHALLLLSRTSIARLSTSPPHFEIISTGFLHSRTKIQQSQPSFLPSTTSTPTPLFSSQTLSSK